MNLMVSIDVGNNNKIYTSPNLCNSNQRYYSLYLAVIGGQGYNLE
jgi:hypothetical protein